MPEYKIVEFDTKEELEKVLNAFGQRVLAMQVTPYTVEPNVPKYFASLVLLSEEELEEWKKQNPPHLAS